jgi:hypothetical protein
MALKLYLNDQKDEITWVDQLITLNGKLLSPWVRFVIDTHWVETNVKEEPTLQSIRELQYVHENVNFLKLFTGSPSSSQMCVSGPSQDFASSSGAASSRSGHKSTSSQSLASVTVVTLDPFQLDGDCLQHTIWECFTEFWGSFRYCHQPKANFICMWQKLYFIESNHTKFDMLINFNIMLSSQLG